MIIEDPVPIRGAAIAEAATRLVIAMEVQRTPNMLLMGIFERSSGQPRLPYRKGSPPKLTRHSCAAMSDSDACQCTSGPRGTCWKPHVCANPCISSTFRCCPGHNLCRTHRHAIEQKDDEALVKVKAQAEAVSCAHNQ
jgi:hypothetical protein